MNRSYSPFASFNIRSPFRDPSLSGRQPIRRAYDEGQQYAPVQRNYYDDGNNDRNLTGRYLSPVAPGMDTGLSPARHSAPLGRTRDEYFRDVNAGRLPRTNPHAGLYAQQRQSRALNNATFAESAPMPQTQEGFARRRTYIQGQRNAAGMAPMNESYHLEIPTAPGMSARSASGNATMAAALLESYKPAPQDYIQRTPEQEKRFEGDQQLVRGLLNQPQPQATTTQAAPARKSPYEDPQGGAKLPSENANPGKINLTMQQAKTMYDNTVQSGGVGQTGYNANSITDEFTALMQKYGINASQAGSLISQIQSLEAQPGGNYRTPQEQQAQQARQQPLLDNPSAANMNQYVQNQNAYNAAAPNLPGNVMPGYTPIQQPQAQGRNPTRAQAQQYVQKYGAQAADALRRDGFDPSRYAD